MSMPKAELMQLMVDLPVCKTCYKGHGLLVSLENLYVLEMETKRPIRLDSWILNTHFHGA